MPKVYSLNQEVHMLPYTISDHSVGIFASKQAALKYILEQYPHTKHTYTYGDIDVYRSEGKIIIGETEFKVTYNWRIREWNVIE